MAKQRRPERRKSNRGRTQGERRKLPNQIDSSTEWVKSSGISVSAWIKALSKAIKEVWGELLGLLIILGTITAVVIEHIEKVPLPVFRWQNAPELRPQELQGSLQDLAENTGASRAFVWAYRVEGGAIRLVFNERWQWQRPELPQISPIEYSLDSPAVRARLASHRQGNCIRIRIDELDAEDWLKAEFRKAFTRKHISCPILLEVDGEDTLGAVALEFTDDYDLDWAEIALLRFAGGDFASDGSPITGN